MPLLKDLKRQTNVLPVVGALLRISLGIAARRRWLARARTVVGVGTTYPRMQNS
jgi:hypothetical protein